MSDLSYLVERLDNDLDRYGWANSDEERRKALLIWMQNVTTAVSAIIVRGNAEDSEAKLIEKGIL